MIFNLLVTNDVESEVKMQFDFKRQPAMAESSTSFNQPDADISDDGLYPFDFNPFSQPNLPVFISSSAYSNNLCVYTDSDSNSASDSNSNFFHGEEEEEEEDRLNIVTDLFVPREQECGADDPDSAIPDAVTRDVNFRVFDENDGFVSSYGNELGFGFGFGSRIEFDRVAFSSELSESSYSSATRGGNSSSDGLRVVGIDSDSDSDEAGQEGYDPFEDSDSPQIRDCLGFGEQGTSNEEESQWGEVDQSEGLSSIMNRIDYLSVSSEVSIYDESDIDEETAQRLQWELLLAVRDYEDYWQFVQNESGFKGTPPAAKNVVENLPSVALTKEELRENNVVCAVCKDDILADVEVTRLPCCHHYHGGCIVPWLCIRNTCPVCRFELPTDDLDYEQRKIQNLQAVFTRL